MFHLSPAIDLNLFSGDPVNFHFPKSLKNLPVWASLFVIRYCGYFGLWGQLSFFFSFVIKLFLSVNEIFTINQRVMLGIKSCGHKESLNLTEFDDMLNSLFTQNLGHILPAPVPAVRRTLIASQKFSTLCTFHSVIKFSVFCRISE